MFRLDTLQLDGHLLSGGDVGSYRGHGQKRGEGNDDLAATINCVLHTIVLGYPNECTHVQGCLRSGTSEEWEWLVLRLSLVL